MLKEVQTEICFGMDGGPCVDRDSSVFVTSLVTCCSMRDTFDRRLTSILSEESCLLL